LVPPAAKLKVNQYDVSKDGVSENSLLPGIGDKNEMWLVEKKVRLGKSGEFFDNRKEGGERQKHETENGGEKEKEREEKGFRGQGNPRNLSMLVFGTNERRYFEGKRGVRLFLGNFAKKNRTSRQ